MGLARSGSRSPVFLVWALGAFGFLPGVLIGNQKEKTGKEARSPSSALLNPFFGVLGSPTEIDYSKKLVPTYYNLSTGPRKGCPIEDQ